MLDTFELIAEATGREERADVVVGEFNASLAEAKEAVADADVATDGSSTSTAGSRAATSRSGRSARAR